MYNVYLCQLLFLVISGAKILSTEVQKFRSTPMTLLLYKAESLAWRPQKTTPIFLSAIGSRRSCSQGIKKDWQSRSIQTINEPKQNKNRNQGTPWPFAKGKQLLPLWVQCPKEVHELRRSTLRPPAKAYSKCSMRDVQRSINHNSKISKTISKPSPMNHVARAPLPGYAKFQL